MPEHDTFADGPLFELDLTAPEQNTKTIHQRHKSSLSKSAAKVRFLILKLKNKPNTGSKNVTTVESSFRIVYQRQKTLLELLSDEAKEVETKRKSLKQWMFPERFCVVCRPPGKKQTAANLAAVTERQQDETHKQDGIWNAILYCKRSFNESTKGMEDGRASSS